jgi:hypothetical protein
MLYEQTIEPGSNPNHSSVGADNISDVLWIITSLTNYKQVFESVCYIEVMDDTDSNLLWQAEMKPKLKPHQLIQSLNCTMICWDISQYVLNESVMSDVSNMHFPWFERVLV